MCLVAVWSAVNVAGTRLQDLAPNIGKIDDPENWEQVHCDVIQRCALLSCVRDVTVNCMSTSSFCSYMNYIFCCTY